MLLEAAAQEADAELKLRLLDKAWAETREVVGAAVLCLVAHSRVALQWKVALEKAML